MVAYEATYGSVSPSGFHFGVASFYWLGAILVCGFLYLLVTDTEAALNVLVAIGKILWVALRGIAVIISWFGRMIGRLFR